MWVPRPDQLRTTDIYNTIQYRMFVCLTLFQGGAPCRPPAVPAAQGCRQAVEEPGCAGLLAGGLSVFLGVVRTHTTAWWVCVWVCVCVCMCVCVKRWDRWGQQVVSSNQVPGILLWCICTSSRHLRCTQTPVQLCIYMLYIYMYIKIPCRTLSYSPHPQMRMTAQTRERFVGECVEGQKEW